MVRALRPEAYVARLPLPLHTQLIAARAGVPKSSGVQAGRKIFAAVSVCGCVSLVRWGSCGRRRAVRAKILFPSKRNLTVPGPCVLRLPQGQGALVRACPIVRACREFLGFLLSVGLDSPHKARQTARDIKNARPCCQHGDGRVLGLWMGNPPVKMTSISKSVLSCKIISWWIPPLFVRVVHGCRCRAF